MIVVLLPSFTITCDDGRYTSDVTLTLRVNDLNDNRPSFGIDEDHVVVSRDNIRGEQAAIYTAAAHDADHEEHNSNVVYR